MRKYQLAYTSQSAGVTNRYKSKIPDMLAQG